MGSLRDRKKAATRQRIADTATVLFLQRGFERVTIGEIADEAGVSKVTVFNYFPRKEDIFFDRVPQAEELLGAALRDRPPGEPPLRALRRLVLDLAEQRHPLGGFRDHYRYFWRTVQGSPALCAHARRAVDALEDHLARLLAEHGDDPHPRLTAAVALAAYRSVYVASARRILAGDDADEVTRDHLAAVQHAFDVLDSGLGSGTTAPPRGDAPADAAGLAARGARPEPRRPAGSRAGRAVSVTTRPARPGDAAALRELALAAYRPYVRRMGVEPAPMHEDYAALVDADVVWVAERDGAVVGLLVLKPRADHLLLDNIAVAPDAQGAGVGARLLDVADDHAHAHGLREVRLYTNEAMTDNVAYYRRHGFRETHRAVDHGYRRVFFTKQL